jgi:uncharacterized protein
MKIGVLSDTHGYLDKVVLDHFASCDEIWHAGDVGDPVVLKTLQDFKVVRSVYGNIDSPELQHQLPEDLLFHCEGLSIFITHITGSPPHYNARVKKILTDQKPDILVCGHSHILKVIKDPKYGCLYINPGAAGNHGFHHIKTILRFDILGREIKNMEVIELGKRGALS